MKRLALGDHIRILLDQIAMSLEEMLDFGCDFVTGYLVESLSTSDLQKPTSLQHLIWCAHLTPLIHKKATSKQSRGCMSSLDGSDDSVR